MWKLELNDELLEILWNLCFSFKNLILSQFGCKKAITNDVDSYVRVTSDQKKHRYPMI